MKNLFDAARVEEVKQRTALLRPDSERQWGKMNALQAVAHCSGGLELALGDMQAHGGATRFGDLPESLLQLCKFRLSLLPIFLILLCGLIFLLLLGGGLLPRKLRLRLRVRLILLRQVWVWRFFSQKENTKMKADLFKTNGSSPPCIPTM